MSTPDPIIDFREAARRAAGLPESAPDARDLTDTGNATHLVQLHGHRLHYIPPWGKWLVCADDGFWVLDHRDVQVRELAKDVGRALKEEAMGLRDGTEAKKVFAFAFRSLNAHAITSMVDLARGIDGIPIDHEAMDADGWLLGVENGVVHLRVGKLRPADPADLMTMRCPVAWDENASAQRWEQALEEWFPDPEVRAYVQRVAGSALVGAQRDHVFVIHYGGGRNGKGTFTRALQRVLGPYAGVIHLSLLVESKYASHDTVKADLFRSRLAIASETAKRVRLDEASVKNLTGADRITARRMREDPWEFDPTHSLWLQTNHLPEIGGRDTGIWSRIRVVKWESTFDGDAQDKDLDTTLAGEAPGILRWLVEGCLSWQEHGLSEPEAVIRETLAYRQSEDAFARFQKDVGLLFRPGWEIQAGELQDMLTDWANVEGLNPPMRDFTDWLKENGARQTRQRFTDSDGKRRQRRFWLGCGIDGENHESEQANVL
jgi:putative DNA primase/helicase